MVDLTRVPTHQRTIMGNRFQRDMREAVGEAVAEAVIDSGAALLEVPVWAWHWEGSEQPCSHVSRARRIQLSPRWLVKKQHALAAFGSQLRPQPPLPSAPVLTENLLSSWLLPWETVFV